mmetsp:Transcript_15880/g.47790  ORF Transcript_15880/g.47790 Transcript_15880/m.47790 type:complete len:363 (-) Transcript_15880:627-1715(-)
MRAPHATGNRSHARKICMETPLSDRAEALRIFGTIVLASQGTMQDGQCDSTPSTGTRNDSSGRALDVAQKFGQVSNSALKGSKRRSQTQAATSNDAEVMGGDFLGVYDASSPAAPATPPSPPTFSPLRSANGGSHPFSVEFSEGDSRTDEGTSEASTPSDLTPVKTGLVCRMSRDIEAMTPPRMSRQPSNAGSPLSSTLSGQSSAASPALQKRNSLLGKERSGGSPASGTGPTTPPSVSPIKRLDSKAVAIVSATNGIASQACAEDTPVTSEAHQAAADGMHPPECEEPRSEVVVVPPMSKPADEPMTGGGRRRSGVIFATAACTAVAAAVCVRSSGLGRRHDQTIPPPTTTSRRNPWFPEA